MTLTASSSGNSYTRRPKRADRTAAIINHLHDHPSKREKRQEKESKKAHRKKKEKPALRGKITSGRESLFVRENLLHKGNVSEKTKEEGRLNKYRELWCLCL